MRESAHKVVVIGLDGGTWDLIDPWIEQGRLPVLEGLVARGTRGVLRSTTPPVSPLAWSTFLTGTNPGKHGIYGFTKRVEGKYRWRTVTASDRRGQPLWAHTDAQGVKSAFFFVPITYPPSPLHGVMISGLGTPWVESDFVYPPHLKPELVSRFGRRYLVEPLVQGTQEQVLEDMLATIDVQTEVFRYVVAKDSYELTVFVFGQTDRVQHFFWKEMDSAHPSHDPATPKALKEAILAVYKHVDGAIGSICESLDEDTTLIVMSDHGCGPYHRDFYLNNWLAREGLLTYKDSGTRGTGSGFPRLARRLIYSAIGLAEGRVPQKMVWPLRKRSLLSHLDQFNANPAAAEIDWMNTRVYSADFWGDLHLNLRGREPNGIVEPGQDQEALLREVEERLGRLQDPETLQPIVARVYRRDELFMGPMAGESPDLIVRCNEPYHCKPQPLNRHEVIVAPGGRYKHTSLDHSAEHRPEGIVLFVGSKIRQGYRLRHASIVDLAPTILYLLGCPLSEELDGVPLLDAIHRQVRHQDTHLPLDGARDAEKMTPGRGYSDDEAREVEERLRALGYM